MPSTACSDLGTIESGRDSSCCVAKPCSVTVNGKHNMGTCVSRAESLCKAMFESDDCVNDTQTCCFSGNSDIVPSSTITTITRTGSLPNAPTATSVASLPVPPTSSLAPTNPFPIAIVAGSVCGAIVLVVVVVVLALVVKKRRRSDVPAASVGSISADGSDGMSSFVQSTRSANPNQYSVIPIAPTEVTVGTPYGSLTSASPSQYSDLQLTPTAAFNERQGGYDVVPGL